MTRRFLVLVVVAALFGAVSLRGSAPISLAQDATPVPAPPPVITSEVLVRAKPVAVETPELSLGRVTIMPGAVIPPHTHPGTQIAIVAQGELTYTVFTGQALWYHGDTPDAVPSPIRPGDTVVLKTGDTLVEAPGEIHEGRNDGHVPLVIYLSTLFPADAPRATLVNATPVPNG
jgi:quercetin dioxygenase-like cupin family protein